MNTHEPVIGMEIHVELKTQSKMFCGCPAHHFAKKPNTQTCPVCLGLPGGLPVPNKKAIEWTIKLGLALGCTITEFSKFDRKNYFYPDLPKGYQISQYDMPFATKGKLGTVRIRRVHLEEDTGKLIHASGMTLIDFNRSGVPLVEIVTEPDIHSAEEAKEFLKKLRQIVRYLDISDADMEKGSMRLEPNISLRVKGKPLPPYKVEVKNINSFNFVKRAIEFEIDRQQEIVEKGKVPAQETRGWDETKGSTVPQRMKEEAGDYRYFPEPDIPPIRISRNQITDIQSHIPELPDKKISRFVAQYDLNEKDAMILCETKEMAEYFEECVKLGRVPAKKLANWIINRKIDIEKVLPATLIKSILEATVKVSIPDKDLEKIVREVLANQVKAVDDYRKGKEQSLMFLVGMVMRQTKGKVDANDARQKIVECISNNG